MDKRRITLIAISIIVVAGINFWFFGSSKAQYKVIYEMVVVTRGEISGSITATGTVEPVMEMEIGTQINGIANKIYVDYNSVVIKGQFIAEMDHVTLQSEATSQRAAYSRTKTEYEYQQRDYERDRGLHEKQLINDTDYEQSVYNYEKAKSNYESSQASLVKAKRDPLYAIITSPVDGIVINRAMEEEQTVASGSGTSTLFATAANLMQVQVVADANKVGIGDVEGGQHVSFTVDTYPNDMFEDTMTQIRLGEDSSIGSGSSTSSTAVTYEVVISAPNPDLKLKPCLTANVTIYMLDRKDVLSVPACALRFTLERPLTSKNDTVKDCESPHKLWTRKGSTFTARPVTTGTFNGIGTEIINDISRDATIVTEAAIGKMLGGRAPADMWQAADEEKGPFIPGLPGGNEKKSR